MRWLFFWIISSCSISLLLSALTIIAGWRQGVLDTVAIASFEYQRSGAQITYTPPREWESVISWFFSVHYLSLCGGYAFSDGKAVETRHLACEAKEAGWIFKGNDPFIVNFQAVHGDGQDDLPVILPTVLPTELHTRTPFALLVSGIAFTVIATVFAVSEGVGFEHYILVRDYQGCLSLIGVAASFQLISSALITKIIYQSQRGNFDHNLRLKSWAQAFLGLTWASAGFMLFATLLKAADALVQKRKRRNQLPSRADFLTNSPGEILEIENSHRLSK